MLTSILDAAKAFLAGVADGYSQPYQVSTSTNLDHLRGDGGHEIQDHGINVGQFLRAGFGSEFWTTIRPARKEL